MNANTLVCAILITTSARRIGGGGERGGGVQIFFQLPLRKKLRPSVKARTTKSSTLINKTLEYRVSVVAIAAFLLRAYIYTLALLNPFILSFSFVHRGAFRNALVAAHVRLPPSTCLWPLCLYPALAITSS